MSSAVSVALDIDLKGFNAEVHIGSVLALLSELGTHLGPFEDGAYVRADYDPNRPFSSSPRIGPAAAPGVRITPTEGFVLRCMFSKTKADGNRGNIIRAIVKEIYVWAGRTFRITGRLFEILNGRYTYKVDFTFEEEQNGYFMDGSWLKEDKTLITEERPVCSCWLVAR